MSTLLLCRPHLLSLPVKSYSERSWDKAWVICGCQRQALPGRGRGWLSCLLCWSERHECLHFCNPKGLSGSQLPPQSFKGCSCRSKGGLGVCHRAWLSKCHDPESAQIGQYNENVVHILSLLLPKEFLSLVCIRKKRANQSNYFDDFV